MTYILLNGDTVDLSSLPREDLLYLLNLQHRSLLNEDCFKVSHAVCGKWAYPLKGSMRVTTEVSQTLLFRVAIDIADRLAVRQNRMGRTPGRDPVPVEGVLGLAEVAEQLDLTPDAVIEAIRAHHLVGTEIEDEWAVTGESVDRYQDRLRAEAGRVAPA